MRILRLAPHDTTRGLAQNDKWGAEPHPYASRRTKMRPPPIRDLRKSQTQSRQSALCYSPCQGTGRGPISRVRTMMLRATLFSIASLALLALVGMLRGAEMPQPTRTIRAYEIAEPLSLDGDLAKWQGAESVAFEGLPLAGHPRRATVYALWDRDYLYLGFDVFSSKLMAAVREHDGDLLCEDDGVEFLIDANHDRSKEWLADDFAYHINVLNVVYDDRGTPAGKPDPAWTGAARHVVRIVDDYHYVVEAAVPWTEIGVKPQAGKTVLGADFAVNGKDPATGKYDYFDWCQLKVFHDASGFGDLVLAGRRKPRR